MSNKAALSCLPLLLGPLLFGVGCDGRARQAATPPLSTSAPSLETLPDPAALLHFVDTQAGRPALAFDKSALLGEGGAIEMIDGYDPYYRAQKRYWAVSLAPLLRRAFPGVELETAELVLRAKDGYAVPIEGARLLDGTAYLALADADRLAIGASWEPIGPRRSDPSPLYLVWKGADRVDLERYPRPWGLERIERARFEAIYPHTQPVGAAADSSAMYGFSIFKRDCIRCHAMNREGGRVGPELNVPQSIIEYRPVAQIRAYIRDPLRFRYGAMPAHPHLSELDLDGLIAYFALMQHHKFDPEARTSP